jgi:ABC-type glycerol-3-phosphate transport system substrate-binding protein
MREATSRKGATSKYREETMTTSSPSRRRVLQAAAIATSAALLAKPFVHGAYAAGKLSVGFWDHWVPGANNTLTKLCNEWADKNKVEITIDYITSQGDKLLLTGAAEAQARSGHDMLTFLAWAGAAQAPALAPLDDLMAELIKENGDVPAGITIVAKQNGHWIAVPATVGSPTLPPCARIDYFKQFVGLDLTRMYPAGAPPDKDLADKWTWDIFLDAARKCNEGGHAFGMPLGVTNDAVAWVYAVLRGFGAQMVDKDGNVTVKSDATKQALEWFRKLVPVLPSGVFAWDDSSNNKALISGQAALIMNPPSAWAVAVRDARPVAEQLWTFPTPKGPKGRFDSAVPYFWGVWGFSKNISAAKSLLAYLCQRSSVEQTVAASKGYDIPPFANLHGFKTWAEEEPPKGTIYNYPPRGDVEMVIPYSESPTRIANQIYAQATATKMIAQCTQQGKTVEQAMDWAAGELEGFSRS